MDLLPISEPRFGYQRVAPLAGDAAPGDVLALAGGPLVLDANANGLVDGDDAALRGRVVDVRA